MERGPARKDTYMALDLEDSRGHPILPRVITHWGDGATALTNRDISGDLSKLDIALSDLRDAIEGTGDKDFTTLETLLATALIRDITKWGGTTLTGRDISADMANIGAKTVTLTHGAAVNVTTATTAVLAANTSRKYALIVNDSDTVMYLAVGASAVLNQGIRLNPGGGSYEMSEKLGNLATGAINGIHGGSGNKVALPTEGV